MDPIKSKAVIENVIKKISNIDFDNKENISNCIKEVCSDMSLKFKDVGPAVRFALTARLKAPSIDELCFTLGKDKALKRLNDFYTFLIFFKTTHRYGTFLSFLFKTNGTVLFLYFS